MAAGVYLHIPFCKSRCSYCDFATDVWRSNDVVDRYVNALCKELAIGSESHLQAAVSGRLKPELKTTIDTIYFGGGTPSLLSPGQIEKVLDQIYRNFEVAENSEITMEMNPATVTPDTLNGYRALGVNRASFGVQTFNDRDLKLLARGHNADDARHTFGMLRDAGFDNISFDLIIGLPGQTLDDWEHNLDEALKMQPEHLSLYLLEIHQGTPLAEQIRTERRPMPDPELAAEMYELMQDRVTSAGFKQYEISNFAKPGFDSRHNTKYWRLDPVYGFGMSAHSFDGTDRYANSRDINSYVQLITASGTAEVFRETIDHASEHAFLGLRLSEGIDIDDYDARFGSRLLEKTAEMIDLGLLAVFDGKLVLTRKGMLLSNEVFSIFV